MTFLEEIERRRTFGIISHPDAGKTTMTKNAKGKHLGLLTSIAEKDKTIAPAIYEYMRTISTKKEDSNVK